MEVPPIKLNQLSLTELQKLGFVCFDRASYYGKMIKVAGEVKGATMDGAQLYLEVKVSGTSDEALLKALGVGAERGVRVHVCEDECGMRTTGDRLMHALEVRKVARDAEDWMTNIEEVIPAANAEDELKDLREAAGMGDGPPPPKEKSKKRKKKDKKDKAVVEDKSPIEVKKGSRERGEKDLPALFGNTGLDPDSKARAKLMRKARHLSKGAKKKKKKKATSSSSSGSSSSSSTSSSFSQTGEGLFDSERRLLVL